MGMFGPKCSRCWEHMDNCICKENTETRNLREENAQLKEENERLRSQLNGRK